HMTGNLKLLCNFVEKFLGTVHFGNDQFAQTLGHGDLNQGNVTIKREIFRKSTCFVRDLQGNDLLIGNRGSDLYTISLQETTSSTPIYFVAKASPTQAWLWHRRLSHLNSSMDETPEVLKDFLTMIQRNFQAQVTSVRTDKDTEFLNKTLHVYLNKKKALNIRLPLLEHLNRTALSKDGTTLLLRLLERCFQLLSFHCHFGLKQLQPHAILR
ncbi:hypothetical protein Tco_0224527, partial [Tanacetum coccineum]